VKKREGGGQKYLSLLEEEGRFLLGEIFFGGGETLLLFGRVTPLLGGGEVYL